MPWRMPSDLRRYRKLTMGKPMIMGRKTLESIGRVLDGRDTIVLTRAAHTEFEGASIAFSAEQAVDLAEARARSRGSREIIIAGGGEIYRLFFERLSRLYVTEIDMETDGDASFPPIDPAVWSKTAEEAPDRAPGDSASARYLTFERRGSD